MLKYITAAVRGSSPSQQSAVTIIQHWQSKPSHRLFNAGRREVTQYFDAVDRLLETPYDRGFTDLITVAMDRLKAEFHAVLKRQVDYHAAAASTVEWSSLTDSTANQIRYEDYELAEPISGDVITYLSNIAKRMNSGGRIEDCVRAYKDLRKPYLRIQLSKLRFEQLSMGGSRRRCVWDELKGKIETWVEVSKICVDKLFRREKQQCDDIFGDNPVKDVCFVETVQEFATSLFDFVESVSLDKQPSEKMGSILALYGAFLWVKPIADDFFSSEAGNVIRKKCAEISSRIVHEVGRLFYEFESTILGDSSQIVDNTGCVHRSTYYVMDSIDLIVQNKQMLTELMKEPPSLHFGDVIIPQQDLGDVSRLTFLEQHLILIIILLQRNLKAKSSSYKDPSLSQLFAMNNTHYVIQRIMVLTELQEMIGESFLNKLKDEMRYAVDTFKALICSKFLACFDENGLYRMHWCFVYRPSKSVVRERIMAFNRVFEGTKSAHWSWTVPDSQLREEIRVYMSEVLVDQYEEFVRRFENDSDISPILEKNIKYSADDLHSLILQMLFADI